MDLQNMSWQELVAFWCSGIVTIILFVLLIGVPDITPATELDYESLETIEVNNLKDLEQLRKYNIDTDVKFDDELIIIDFETSECKVTKKYDESFNVLSVSREDKSTDLFSVLIIVCFTWFALYCISVFPICVFLFVVTTVTVTVTKILKTAVTTVKKILIKVLL